MYNLLLALLVTLMSNVTTTSIGNKEFVVFEHTYSDTLDSTYQASYLVDFNTPSGIQTVGYAILVPAGASGFNIYPFRITTGWTVASWERTGWGPYIP